MLNYSENGVLIELSEAQLRQLSDSQAVFENLRSARAAALEVRGSMRWKTTASGQYLLRVSTSGAEKSLGPKDERTLEIFESFSRRKDAARARLRTLEDRADEMRKLNRVYRVGRTPAVVVRCLNALEKAGLSEQFMVVGTHALYAYETAAGVRVETGALATQDLDILFDMNKLRFFSEQLKKTDARSLIDVLRAADPTFRVRRDKLETAVNDAGFEIDVIRRSVTSGDPHPLRMSDDEDDFWAVQADQGQKMASVRKFRQMVVAANGEMALMRTLHPLDFARLKDELSARLGRDPRKAPKDKLQAALVRQMWEQYLQYLAPLRP